MKVLSALGAAVLATAQQSGMPAAATSANSSTGGVTRGLSAIEFAETLPPVGFVHFCSANPKECARYSLAERMAPARLAMTPESWNLLYQVNTYVNSHIKPASDQELYGIAENWTYPVNAGDCEDYLLLKKRKLEALGFPARDLRITVVLQEKGEGHAVLTVTTTEGDYVLDNRRNDILPWKDTQYTYLKRQSGDDPKRWVALVKTSDPQAASTAASGE
jgi:predicted transglutaminase-like cysteine proteinase